MKNAVFTKGSSEDSEMSGLLEKYRCTEDPNWISWNIAMGLNDLVGGFLDEAQGLGLDVSEMVNKDPGKGVLQNTALHVAVAKAWPAGHIPGDNGNLTPQETSGLELVTKLIRAGANPNLENWQSSNRKSGEEHPLLDLNHTPLSLAVVRGNEEMVNKILCSEKLERDTVEFAIFVASFFIENNRYGANPILGQALVFSASEGFQLFSGVPNNNAYKDKMLMIHDKLDEKNRDMLDMEEIMEAIKESELVHGRAAASSDQVKQPSHTTSPVASAAVKSSLKNDSQNI